MEYVKAEHFLLDQVPIKHRALLPAALKSAYDAVDLLVKGEPILQTPSAVSNRGRLISWAVDLAIAKLIDSGRWPVDYRWRKFAKPTGRYLEVRLPHSLLTVSLVKDPARQPRNVVFRANGRLGNQMFLDLPEFADEAAIQGLPTFLLLHGYKSFTFVHLGVPAKQHSLGYYYRTPNLLTLMHHASVEPDVPPPEGTDIEAAVTLKEEIERWRRDNNDE